MVHLGVGLSIQFVVGLVFGAWWLGATAATGFFLGREIAQAEYRVIQQHYGGKRAQMPWYGAAEPRAWTRKGLLDWVLPAAATFAVAIYLT
jgi:hypothetical protein